jgi:hypothetical protein
MKPYPILFDRLVFGPDSIVRKHWFEKDDLHLDLAGVGAATGEGSNIRLNDFSEAILVFRGVSAWQRKTCPRSEWIIEKSVSDLRETPSAIAGLPPVGFVINTQPHHPSAMIVWNIVARVFECYLHEEDIKKLDPTAG